VKIAKLSNAIIFWSTHTVKEMEMRIISWLIASKSANLQSASALKVNTCMKLSLAC
jgi:hypothetical protein